MSLTNDVVSFEQPGPGLWEGGKIGSRRVASSESEEKLSDFSAKFILRSSQSKDMKFQLVQSFQVNGKMGEIVSH